MNASTKLHVASAGYCAVLISLNWGWSIEYSRKIGLRSESATPMALSFLLTAAVVVYLVYRCVRAILSRLETGQRVREGRWIEHWTVIFYPLPLLWHQISGSSWIEPDGAVAHYIGGYGGPVVSPLSSWIFLLAILGLLLFQVLRRLDSDDSEPDHPLQPARVARG